MAYNYDLIVWAAPIFTLLMVLEYLWGQAHWAANLPTE